VTHHSTVPHLDVIVEDEQLSLAIGKRGQNVRLASELINCKIDIKSESDVKDEVAGALARMLQSAVGEEAGSLFGRGEELEIDWTSAPGVDADAADALTKAGFGTYEALAEADSVSLEAAAGPGLHDAAALVEWARSGVEPAGRARHERAESQAPKMNDDEFMAALSRALKESESERESVEEAAALPGEGDEESP
jgi:N utilization substance protein A